MKRTHNLSSSKEIRRQLRSNSTAAEAVLWTALKSRKLDGFQWRRQFSIGDYVLDFYCPKTGLCVELDGAAHYTAVGLEADAQRTRYLSENHGITVLRLENRELWSSPEMVLALIKKTQEHLCKDKIGHTPPPSGHLP